jgi:polyisoprenoid-binding protein YceI
MKFGFTSEENTMSCFKASAIRPRMASAVSRSAAALGLSLAVSALSTQAFGACSYTVTNQWNNGYTATIKITNSGTTAINGWTVGWTYAGNNRMTSSYNATITGTNPYTATNLSWNGSLAPNASAEFGIQGSKTDGTSAEVPSLTGAACSGSLVASSVAPSSAAPSSAAPSSVAPSSVAPSSVAPSSVRSSVAPSSVASSAPTTGAGVLFSDTFETGAVNTQPAGWENFIGWVPNNGNTATGAQYALIDSSKSYNGSKSIHFKGGAAPAQIMRKLPANTQRIYTRAYVNMSKVLGNDPGDNHEHIMGLKKTPDANDEIRVGQIKGVLGTNHIPSDNIAPKMSQWNSGPQMKANTWYCVETAYLADMPYDSLYMYVDGALVHSITSAADWNNGALAADWMSDKFNYVMFGWHSFSGNNADVWMDDIVVSTQPIGCGAVAPASSSASSVRSSVAPSSVAPSSVAPSSVASSSAAPSSVRSSVAPSSVASSSAVAVGGWSLNTTDSYFNFVTTKNTNVVEAHNFTSISGGITSAGVATLTIDLSSGNTGIALRDQRLDDLLFEVATYPTATATVNLTANMLSGLAVGSSTKVDVSASLNLHGVVAPVTTTLLVQKLSNSRILVQTLSPILVSAPSYSLTDGVEALRAAVGIASISTAVPVDFVLVFDAR